VNQRGKARAVQTAQARYPAGHMPVAPLNRRRTRNPHPATDFRVRHTLGSQQHDPRPLRQPRLHRRGTHQRIQPRLITDTKNKRGSNRHTPLSQNHTVKSLPTRHTRTAFAVFGGAAMLVLAVGCGGGSNKGPSSTTTPTTTTTTSPAPAPTETPAPGPGGTGGPGGGGGTVPGGPTGGGGPGG